MNREESKAVIYKMATNLSRNQQVDFIIYLLETTDLTMLEIGNLVGRSESGVYRINAGQRHRLESRSYPIRPARNRSSLDYFYPQKVLDHLNQLESI